MKVNFSFVTAKRSYRNGGTHADETGAMSLVRFHVKVDSNPLQHFFM